MKFIKFLFLKSGKAPYSVLYLWAFITVLSYIDFIGDMVKIVSVGCFAMLLAVSGIYDLIVYLERSKLIKKD